MSKQKKGFVLCMVAAAVMLVVSLLLPTTPKTETVQEAMRDAVLHESNRIDLFGKEVNPGLISAMTVSGILLVVAACLRIFVIPRFQYVPGRLQLLLEELVGLFDRMAKSNSPERNGFLGAYIFGAGVYIFTGTIFELFGLQAVTPRATPSPCRRPCRTSTPPSRWGACPIWSFSPAAWPATGCGAWGVRSRSFPCPSP